MSKNNKGFSLVELIVIIAIIAIAGGAAVLSVSLVTGSEAKKAFQKLEAQLDEVKTGSMSRFDENLTIKYLEKDAELGQDTEGYYVVKEIKTIKPSTTSSGIKLSDIKPLDENGRSMGEEKRRLADNRVTITVTYADGTPYVLLPDGTSSLLINYDRATGLLKDAKVTDDTGEHVGKLKYISCQSGMRTYTMEFNDAGKHVRIN